MWQTVQPVDHRARKEQEGLNRPFRDQKHRISIPEGINTPGSVAVYTAYCVPFTNDDYPDFEKVDY